MQPHGDAPGAEGLLELAEAAGDGGLAVLAAAGVVEVVTQDLVPVAFDHWFAAAGTGGGVAGLVVHVAGVDVAQAGIHGDLACAAQRVGWRCRRLGQFVVGMEGREMQRYVGAKFLCAPGREFA